MRGSRFGSGLLFILTLTLLGSAPAWAERTTPGTYQGANGRQVYGGDLQFVKTANENEFEFKVGATSSTWAESDVTVTVRYPKRIPGGEIQEPKTKPYVTTFDQPFDVLVDVLVKWTPPADASGRTIPDYATIFVVTHTQAGGPLSECQTVPRFDSIELGKQIELRATLNCTIEKMSTVSPTVGTRIVIQANTASGSRLRHSDLSFGATYDIKKAADYVVLSDPNPVPEGFRAKVDQGNTPPMTATLEYFLSSHPEANLSLIAYVWDRDRNKQLIGTSDVVPIKRVGDQGQVQTTTLTIPSFKLPEFQTRMYIEGILKLPGAAEPIASSTPIEYRIAELTDILVFKRETFDPPVGTVFAHGVIPKFAVEVEHELLTLVPPGAEVSLRAYFRNEDFDLVLLKAPPNTERVKNTTPVKRGTLKLTLTDIPTFLEEGRTEPLYLDQIFLKAVMIDPRNFDKLAETEAVSFQVAPYDLTIDHVEAVQVIQTKNNEVPLVPGKATVIRVFPKAGANTSPDLKVTAEVKVFILDEWLDHAPYTGPIKPKTAPGRAYGESLDFKLPALYRGIPFLGGLIENKLEFTVELLRHDGKPLPTTMGSEPLKFSVDIKPEPYMLDIAWVPFCYKPPDLAQEVCPSPDVAGFANFMRKVYPTRDHGIRYRRLAMGKQLWEQAFGGRGSDALKKWETKVEGLIKSYDGPAMPDQLVVWLPNVGNVERNLGRDFTLVGGSLPIWDGKRGRASWVVERTDQYANQFILAHEVAHNFDLRHAATPDGCGAAGSESKRRWPYPNALVQEWGLDLETPTYISPQYKDFMSYCEERWERGPGVWVSPHHYRKLIESGLQPTYVRPQTSSEAESKRRETGRQEYLIVSGKVHRNGAGSTIDSVFRVAMHHPDIASDPSGSACIALGDGAADLSTFCWEPSFEPSESWEDQSLGPFDEDYFVWRIPHVDGTAKVSLRKDGQEVAGRSASASAPTVSISGPQTGASWTGGTQTLSWNSSDTDGDAVQHMVHYSPDGGTSWIPLETSTTAKRTAVDTTAIEGGPDVHFRVLASDGLQTASARVGPVTVVQQPAIELANTAVDFRHVMIRQGAASQLGIANNGSGPLRVTAARVDNQAFMVAGPETPFQIWPGEERALDLRFIPEAAGEQSATLTVESDATNGATLTATLTGEGISETRPDIETSPASLDFGSVDVGQSKELTVTLRNHGPGPLQVESVRCPDSRFVVTSGSGAFELAPGEAAVTVQFTPDGAGETSTTLTIASNDPDRPSVQIPVRGAGAGSGGGDGGGGGTGPRPAIGDGGIVNAASFLATLSRGGIGSIYGTELAAGVVLAKNVPLPRLLGGVRVRVNGIDAPLYFVSPNQVNFQVPFEVPLTGTVEIVVIRDGRSSAAANAVVAEYAPGIFTNAGTGDPIVQRHPDLAVISSAIPAKGNDVLIVYLTGIGGVDSLPATGEPTGVSPVPKSRVTPTVTLGGAAVNVLWSGLAPYMIGVGQINLQLGATLSVAGLEQRAATTGVLPLVIRFGQAASQEVMLPVELDVSAAPSIQVTPESLSFGDVDAAASSDRPFTIANNGQGPLTVTSLSSGDSRFSVVSPAAPFTVPAGGLQTVTVRFQPGAAGDFVALLTVRSNDPLNPTKIVTLMGRGTATQTGSPRMVVDPIELVFPPILVGQWVRATATVYNMGDAPLIVSSITPGAPELTILSPPVPFTVAPGASQEVVVQFQAAADGEMLAFVDLVSNDPLSAGYAIPVTATGMAPVETDVPSGVTMAFETPALPQATLFNGATSVIVPPGAAALDIRLETLVPGVDVDLFVRYMEDVFVNAEGFAVVDHSATTPGGNESLLITSASDPPLTPGRYFVAFGKFTPNVAAEVRITATVIPGSAAGFGTAQPSRNSPPPARKRLAPGASRWARRPGRNRRYSASLSEALSRMASSLGKSSGTG